MSYPTPVRDYRTIVDDSNNPGYVNRILIGAKQALHIEQVRAGEVDIFNKARDIINVLATMAATIAHLLVAKKIGEERLKKILVLI